MNSARGNHPRAVLFTGVLLCLLLAACGDGSGGSGCIDLGDFEGTLVINIGCGDPVTRPLYDWDPDKPAFSLEVFEVGSSDYIWRILSNSGDNTIVPVPPIAHGVAPFGTTADGSSDILEFNVEYRVRVIQLNGETGVQDFTLLPP